MASNSGTPPEGSPGPALRVAVLLPVYDDWASAAELVKLLDREISESDPGVRLDIVMVDDGSAESWSAPQFSAPYVCIDTIGVLRLCRNLGHQRAIAIGLVYIERGMRGDGVVVMDADGEDTPQGAAELIRAFRASGHREKLIFAERARRMESFSFRMLYRLYKALHYALTGVAVRVGNFSIVPWGRLSGLTSLSELWNHYAAAVFHSRLPYGMIPIARGRRIAGASRMNFVSLVMHGLSAVSVFADIVGVRLLIASVGGSLVAALGIAAAIAVRVFTDAAIPGWATYSAGILTVILIQMLTMAACFTFLTLSSRTAPTFIPHRDAPLYIKEVLTIYPHA
jgi:hypothetical protein